MHVQMADHPPLELGEGPRWDAAARRTLLVDILGGRVLRRPAGQAHYDVTAVDGHVGAVAPVSGDTTRLLAAIDDGVGLVDLGTGAVAWLARPERARSGRVRMNDGACDPQGRFVVGTMSYDEQPGAGRLWRIDGRGRVEQLLDRCTVPNGLVWSGDGSHLFHVDSGHGTITRYRYDDGGVHQPEVIYRPADGDGTPDGMCGDADGTLWVAFWGGACVRRLTTDGRVLDVVRLPMTQTTACWFVGDAQDHLLVTSARTSLDDPQAADGRSAVIDVGGGVRGWAATPFALQDPSVGA